MATITPNDTRTNKINPHLVSFISFLNGFDFWLQVLHSQCGFDLHINNILRKHLKTQYYRSTKAKVSTNKPRTCCFVRGNVATLTITVSNIIAKPYAYGTCTAESPSFKIYCNSNIMIISLFNYQKTTNNI